MRLINLVFCAYVFVGVEAARAAPPQLYNKTVSIGWSVQSTQRDPGGQEKAVSSNIQYTVYVSSAGRLFERSSRAVGKRVGSSDSEPGAGQTKMGEARGLRFEGNNLVANRSYAGGGGSGAMRAVVSFDSSYSSCSVSVTHGKENGGVIKRKGLDGVVREMRTMTVTGTNCSVRAGNAFANN
jgi:hypothetical protein